jgi:hypothetical protein
LKAAMTLVWKMSYQVVAVKAGYLDGAPEVVGGAETRPAPGCVMISSRKGCHVENSG